MSFNWAKKWTRSDAIAGLALAFSAAAACIAYQAENRATKAERREAEAVAVALGGKVRTLASSAEFSAQFMQGFLEHKAANPNDNDQMDFYIIEFAAGLELPELVLTAERVTALSRTNSNVAALLSTCSERRTALDADSKKFSGARPGQLTDRQLAAAQAMPYYLREMGKACSASLNALTALVPDLLKILGPIPGTVGEMMEAETSALSAREHGFYMKLYSKEANASGQD